MKKNAKCNAKCKICGNSFVMGYSGTVDGCDKCTKTVRDSEGNSWSPDEKYHDYLDIASGKVLRVKRRDALNPE